MGLSNTNFDSPHGLPNYQNTSTAQDVAILTFKCMQIQFFAQIVKTPYYSVETPLRSYEWYNTNKLLGVDVDCEETVEMFEGTLGCKTGITQTAGPCFSGCFARHNQNKVETDNVIVVVLGSKSMESRWTEVPQLVKWYQQLK